MWARRITALAATLLLAAGAAAPARAQEQPNLLVIMTDDQRADGTLAVMPQTRRAIARQGRRFVQAYTTTPKCCPSRASFFTGRYPHNHRVVSNLVARRLDHTTTVQYLVRAEGYRTGMFGKFLNGWPIALDPPYFDEWAIMSPGYRRATWNIDGLVADRADYTTDLIADRAVQFVRDGEREDEQPWLAWVTPYAPHLPSTPADRHRGASLPRLKRTPAMFEADWSDKPELLDRARGFRRARRKMRRAGRRSLMAVDDLVGRLVHELRVRGERRQTLVVFTSDNGFLLGEHGGLTGKDLPHPASAQIPLLLRWPGRVRPGTVSTDLVLNIDVGTTLLRAAGVPVETDGRSLLARRPRAGIFLEHSGGRRREPDALPIPAWRALVTPSFRYAEYYEDDALVGREYYDHLVDPWELENRADELDPLREAALSASLGAYSECTGSTCP